MAASVDGYISAAGFDFCVKPSLPDESFTYGNTLLVSFVEYVTGPVAAGVAVEVFDGESGELIGEV